MLVSVNGGACYDVQLAIANMPSSCEVLVYKQFTSIVARMAASKARTVQFKPSSIFRKCVVSLTNNGTVGEICLISLYTY